jgi:hypothetical protein
MTLTLGMSDTQTGYALRVTNNEDITFTETRIGEHVIVNPLTTVFNANVWYIASLLYTYSNELKRVSPLIYEH